MNKIKIYILFSLLLLVSCQKDYPCKKTTGSLLIINSSVNKQEVQVGTILNTTIDSKLNVYDLTQGVYEINATDQVDGSMVTIFVEIKRCEESKITI